MRHKKVIRGILSVVVASALGTVMNVTLMAANEKTVKSKYLITSPHTAEECLKALDEVNAQGPQMLSKYDWGCMSGDHTGYVVVEAANDADARNMVPAAMREKAKVVKLNKFTPEQIKSFHEKH